MLFTMAYFGGRTYMNFKFYHCNINVRDIDRSVKFYKEALGLSTVREKEAGDGSFKLVFLANNAAAFQIELTWLRGHADRDYDLGENESHLAFRVDDFEAAKTKHDAMGCVCFENPDMGVYFIEDPDGYWIEIVPER